MIINEETRYVKTYKLEVTEEELAVIHTLVCCVGGDPLSTWRGIASDIYKSTKEYFLNFGYSCRTKDCNGIQAVGNIKSLVDSCRGNGF